jgi:hypothetical protein
LSDVRAAAATGRPLLESRAVPPLRALIANAGPMSADTRLGPVASDRDRERRLWAATAELLGRAGREPATDT